MCEDGIFALAYNLRDSLQKSALPKPVEHWSLTTLREKLIKIGAKVVRHADVKIHMKGGRAPTNRLKATRACLRVKLY